MNKKVQKDKRNEEYVNNDDWKRWKMGWPYNGDVNDPLYIMERAEFFKKNGNGWWWYAGYHDKHKKKIGIEDNGIA